MWGVLEASPYKGPMPVTSTDKLKPRINNTPDKPPAPCKASGSMAVAIMVSIAPPVMPSAAETMMENAVLSSGFTSPMLAAIAMHKATSAAKATNHMPKAFDADIPCVTRRLEPLNDSGKFAMQTAKMNSGSSVPALLLQAIINASGMPSSITPSHIARATLDLSTTTSFAPSPPCEDFIDICRRGFNAAIGQSSWATEMPVFDLASPGRQLETVSPKSSD
mmetsp:Transcript_116075/g.335246  ORF Transcript_116075/g.335246 Transcript_116075/m.335246 type:complete len:221 (-) Transcript_116075:485-1147(-)